MSEYGRRTWRPTGGVSPTCPNQACPHAVTLHERDERWPTTERCTVPDCPCQGWVG